MLEYSPMLTGYLRAFIDIIFPPRCFICEKKTNTEIICIDCREKIKPLNPPLCRVCAREIRGKDICVCNNCRKRKVFYDKVISCFVYEEPLKSLIHLSKYKYYDYIMEFLSITMVKHILAIGFSFKDYDFITSVPTHLLRLREREYNQSNIIAKKISKFLKIPLKNGIIYCKKNRPSQSGLKKEARLKNVEDNFFVKEDLTDKNIIIIDDVITTGSTLSECAKALKEKGANKVLGLTLAKAQ